jgi:hypothetical protein
MKKFYDIIKPRIVTASVLAAIAGFSCLLWQSPTVKAQAIATGNSLSQATGLVTPRTWTVFSQQIMSNGQVLASGTISNATTLNTLVGTNDPNSIGWLTNQPGYVIAPTLIPNGPAHAIGLIAIINNTNNFAHSSNIVVNVYAGYDTTGGNTASVSARYGQLFSATPILAWTITYTTNGIYTTNIPSSVWEPATCLGYAVTNTATATAAGAVSNVYLTLLQTVAP